MSEYTYSLPFTYDKFMQGIVYLLKRSDKYDIVNLLKGCSLDIEECGYSYYNGGGGRWNAYAININFYVNPANLDSLDKHEVIDIIRNISEQIIPANVGYDIKDIIFKLDLSKDFELEDDLIIDLEKNSNSISASIINDILPEDIKIKGYHMAETYTYLYAIENSLRLFIEKVCKEKYGDSYFSSIVVSKALNSTIQNRKDSASNKKWLSIRGSELFLLDFKDLGNLIDSNWDLFKIYFPNRDFIIPKLNEMADCRNLIAHNSYIGDIERNLMKTYYNVILKQITSYYSIATN